MFRHALALFVCVPTLLCAQSKDSTRLDFSGVLFANYQYRTDDNAQSANKFDVERAYLTFRMPAGRRASVRITGDLYQQSASGSDAYYRGWSLRAKYAYLQHNYLTSGPVRGAAKIGLLQTVFIEHDESFWPRWIATSPTDRNGFFSSADAGLANTIVIPAANVELYTTITNGPGYTSREIDRFKDFAARLTLRPWQNHASSPAKGLALSAWASKGSIASRFVAGGAGQVGPIGDALERSRWGIHAGTKSSRLTLAAQYASRIDEGETGENTAASPRIVTDSTIALTSAYGIVRPFPSRDGNPHPLALLARIDRVTTKERTRNNYDIVIGGVTWDLSRRVAISIDHQATHPRGTSSTDESRTWFAHLVASF